MHPEWLTYAQARRIESTEAGKLRGAVGRVVTQAIADACSSLRLGENVGLAVVSETDLANHALPPEEERILPPRACQRKRVEFALGRTAAHFALKQIGIQNPDPVLRGPGGEPLWRDGIVGSITHCGSWGVAVVFISSGRFAIGLDLETMEGIQETDISHIVCHVAELEWALQGRFQERMAMMFSAKEAVYKAFYPLCHRYIDFKEVMLTWSPERNRFQAAFLAPPDPKNPQRKTCVVYCSCDSHWVISFVVHQFPVEGTCVEVRKPDSPLPQNPVTGCISTS